MINFKKLWTSKKILMCCSVIIVLCMAASFKVYAIGSSSNTKGIKIDGYYDDWEGKPITKITWGSYNGTQFHDASMIKDNDNIYIYVRMNASYQSPIPTDAIYLTINDTNQCMLFIRYANSQNTTDWSHNVDLTKNGIYTGLHPFTSYPNNSLGDAAVTVSQGDPNDRLEMRINIEALEKVMNLKSGTINNASKISLYMPNVGKESVVLLGTSTAPIIGVGLCIVSVVAVILYRKKVRALH